MRVARAVVLQEDVRRRLGQHARGRSTPVRVALRSRIVLLAGEGLQNEQIAAEMGIAPRTVARWRDRFLKLGIAGLLKDAARPGRKPSIPASVVAQVIEKTTQSSPASATHWSRSKMSREVGISDSTVGRIWRANGLKPHRVDSFKISNDPQFASKLEAIVGLYLNPPEHALVLSVDEKSNGTTTLFAALDTATGEVFGLCQEKHRHQEWLKFLRMIDQTIPEEKEIYLICDNYATHKHARVQRWLQSHKRFHVRFTPTSASWLNMVERFFRDLTQNQLKRGVFHDLEQLITTIGNYIDAHNQKPKPFIWTAKASDILEKVTRAQTTLNKRPSV
jgi:transposase